MDLHLGDPNTFAHGVPHEELAELRRTTPVAWQELPDGGGFHAVLRHADVVTVARDPATFSAEQGGVVIEDDSGEITVEDVSLDVDIVERRLQRGPVVEIAAGHLDVLTPRHGRKLVGIAGQGANGEPAVQQSRYQPPTDVAGGARHQASDLLTRHARLRSSPC